MQSLKTRHLEPELMDQPDLPVRDHRHALISLGRANLVSGTAADVWPAIRAAARRIQGRPVRILDIACGGGQVATSLALRTARAGISAEVIGCDLSPVALDFARAHASSARAARVTFVQANALDGEWPSGADVVICTLFLHHLNEDDAVQVLARMKQAAAHGVVVSDLRRTPLGYLFAWVGCRLLSRSRIFHLDGAQSVRAAFTTGEARVLAARAGLESALFAHAWPQRWTMTWTRPVH